MRRRASKVDANHRTIIAAFKAHGCSVRDNSAAGNGLPDLAVGFLGVTHLVEVKDGKKIPSKRQRTPAQVKWAEDWKGEPPVLVESIDDVAACVKRWKAHAPDAVLHSAPDVKFTLEHGYTFNGFVPPTVIGPPTPPPVVTRDGQPVDVTPTITCGPRFVQDFDADDYNGRPPRSEGLMRNPLDVLNRRLDGSRFEARVTPNVIRNKGGAR